MQLTVGKLTQKLQSLQKQAPEMVAAYDLLSDVCLSKQDTAAAQEALAAAPEDPRLLQMVGQAQLAAKQNLLQPQQIVVRLREGTVEAEGFSCDVTIPQKVRDALVTGACRNPGGESTSVPTSSATKPRSGGPARNAQ